MRTPTKKDPLYVLQIHEGGRWRNKEKKDYPSPLIEAAHARRKMGERARVMHGTTEVDGFPGVF